MDHESLVRAVDRELSELAAAVRDGRLDARVPTCPDFTVDDLAHHVGEFCGFWSHVLCEGTGRCKPPFPGAPGQRGRVGWLQNIGDQLVAELAATDPATEVWTWHPSDHSAAFVARRCAHELAIHRVDAQLARGSAQPIEAGLAADGIEELFVILAFYERAGLAGCHRGLGARPLRTPAHRRGGEGRRRGGARGLPQRVHLPEPALIGVIPTPVTWQPPEELN